MTDSKVLIVTGMHRSGTSLVASLLGQAGVDLGDELLGPAIGNPRGHFEDLDFLRLQEGWLEAAGSSILVEDPAAIPMPGEEEREKARELIARRGDKPIWGFKDPRTTLYLDLWDELLPEARYLFVFRHPLEVTLSLVRRGSDLEAVTDPYFSFAAWSVYNRKLLEFVRRRRERCFLCHVEAVVADIPGFTARIAERFGLTLEEPDPELFHRDELVRQVTRTSHRLLEHLLPEVTDLLSELEHESDLRRDPPGEETEDPALLAFERLLDSELDIERSRRALLILLLSLFGDDNDRAVRRAVKDHKANLASHRLHARNLEAVVQEHEEAREQARQHLAHVETQYQKLEQELARRGEELTLLRTQIEQRDAQIEQRDAQIEQRDAEIEQRDAKIERRDAKIEQRDAEIEQRDAEIEQRDAEIEQRDADIEQLRAIEAVSKQHQKETLELRAHLGELTADREALADHVATLEARLTDSEQDRKVLAAHAAELEVALSTESDAASRWRAELEEARRHLSDLGQHAKNLEGLTQQRGQRIEELERHTGNLEGELERHHGRIEELERHTANLEEIQRWSHERILELERHTKNLEQMLGLGPTPSEGILPGITGVEAPPSET